MLLNVEHLAPGMILARDIELKAGSFLITRKDLNEGRLTPKAIESIRKFSHQFVPDPGKVVVRDDEQVVRRAADVLRRDLRRIEEQVTSGDLYPNFLADGQLQAKVMRVMEMLFSKPDIVRVMYETRFDDDVPRRPADMVIDHQIRVTLLTLALGVKMGWAIIGLMSLGTAALLHDIGLLDPRISDTMQRLDELTDREVAEFITAHEERSVELIRQQDLKVSSYHRNEIFNIVGNHHDPGQDETGSRSSLLFYFADLLDEMVSALPHGRRYNITGEQLEVLGDRFRRRVGLVELLAGLNRLYRKEGGLRMEIVSNLAALFRMSELLVEDFAGKLDEIIEWCPYDSAAANPPFSGNFTPHTIYCSRSNEEGFSCQYMMYVNVKVKHSDGGVREYIKCGELDPRLKRLVEGGGQ